METTPTTQPEIIDSAPSTRATYAGRGLLSLIFLVAGFLAYTYFSETAVVSAAATQTQTAAVAIAAQKAAAREAFQGIGLQAESAIVFDASTGVTLFARNSSAQLPLASITKVPLALAVSEALPADAIITLTHGVQGSGTTDSLSAGSRWRVRDLVDFTLVGSSNDGAQALADAADESLRIRYPEAPAGGAAVWLMNKLVRDLGLPHSYFLNPTGLDESLSQSGSYGSAADTARLFAYAASTSRDIFEATAQKEVTITSLDGAQARAVNTDAAIEDIPGLVLGKTGFTDLAGGNLAVVADLAPNHRIVAVVLGSTREGRFSDIRTLIVAAQASLSLFEASSTPPLN